MEFNNKWSKHFSVETDATALTPSINFIYGKLGNEVEEVYLMVVEDDAELLGRWKGRNYRLGQISVALPKEHMGLWAVGVYLDNEVMLEWDVAVISKQGEIYKMLEKLQHQQYFHVCVLDISGRSHELIEFTNLYCQPQHVEFNFIQDVKVEKSNVQALINRTFALVSSEDVLENLRAAAG